MTEAELAARVAAMLSVGADKAQHLIQEAERLYVAKMRKRFSDLKVAERLKRTNPFLLRIRGLRTVREWASLQVQSALFASEEEAVGHFLEAIAKTCHPNARPPRFPDDFDYEVPEEGGIVAYQVKMSWDCMPMSSRKNLSNTIRRLKQQYTKEAKQVTGVFAPCYGRKSTSKPPGQEYVAMASREFWQRVGCGDASYDVKVGAVCELLCSEFRKEIGDTLVPALIDRLEHAAQAEIGGSGGAIDYERLFRRVNQ